MFNRKTHHYEIEEKGQDRFYTGLFVGVIIGAGLYWLFRSSAGKKMHKAIMNSEADWAQQVKELLEQTNAAQFFAEDDDEQDSIAPVSPIERSNFMSQISNLTATTPASLKRRFFKTKH